MNVQKIKIKQFKKLTDINADINGNHILLVGDNGVGKSSLIQFLEIALGKQTNVPPNAIGEGEVIFDKDGNEIKCKVTFKDGKPILKISGKGINIDNNKGAIASLFGGVDFDIDEFAELSKTKAGQKKQIEIFKSFLSPEFVNGLVAFENDVKNAYDERTEINKDINKLKGLIASSNLSNLPDFELMKIKEVDIKGLTDKINKANKINNDIERIEQGLKERTNKLNSLEIEISNLKKDIENATNWLSKNSKVNVLELEQELSGISEQNAKYLEAQKLLNSYKEIETLTNEAGELTAKIESSKEAINNAIREMETPVKGLTFDNETLIYNGLPVNPDTLSTSEIIELGIRMKMAENPDLGILFIQRGESIGAERLKLIKELADNEGWQIIMEQVQRGQKELTIELFTDEA